MTRAEAANHPLAPRMAAIAFLSQNATLGAMFGSFGLLLVPMEAKLGVGREASSLGMPLVMLGMSLTAPVAGALSARVSLRLLMILGAAASALGYALLALATATPLYLAAYGLLIGPGLCLVGTINPSTLVTRWFVRGRGRALGFVHMPLMVALVPLGCAFVLRDHGASLVYLLLAAMMAVLIVPLLFVVDHPPIAAASDGTEAATASESDIGTAALLRRRDYWALVLAAAAISTGGTVLVTHLAPMVKDWGMSVTQGATLLAVMALSGIAGSLLFGWLADRLGGGWALALDCVGQGLLWGLLLLRPPFPALAVVIALIGLQSSAISPVMAVAMAERFNGATFGRALGLSNLLTLPFLVAGVPIGAWIYVHTGSYARALMAQIAFFVFGALMAVSAGRRRGPQGAALSAP